MTKLQTVQKNARNRMVRFRRKRKAARFTNLVFRKAAQAGANRWGAVALVIPGGAWTLAGVGLAAEVADVFLDVPWYLQPIVGTLEGAGDCSFASKVGALIP